MKLGVAIEDTWGFFHEIYQEFQTYHDVTLFKRRETSSPVFHTRINQYMFNQDMQALLRENEVVFFEWASHLLAAASRLPKTCKIVTRLHRFELNQWADKINWDNVDLLIVVCQTKKDEVLERFPDLAGRVEVVYGAVDTQKFKPNNKPYAGDVGILCHMTPRKRVYELILAFNDALKLKPNLKLHIGGGMHVSYRDYYDAMHDTVGRLGLEDSVKFYGHVERPQTWYENVDVVFSNGYSEGLQVSPLEAMSCGRYVLSHFWSGADEMLPSEYLYFTNEELVDKLIAYDASSENHKKEQADYMRNRAVEKFNINHTSRQIRELVEAVHSGGYA